MFSDMASKVFEGQIPGSLLKKKHWGNTENFMDFVSLDKGKLLTACVNSGLYKMILRKRCGKFIIVWELELD